MQFLTKRGALRLLAGAAGAVIVAAASGSGALADDLKHVKVLRSPGGTFEPLYIAQKEGLFQKHGLDVEIEIGGLPDQQVAQLVSGQADMAMGSATSLITAAANNVPIQATANMQDTQPPATTALLVPPGSPVKKVEDLAGKTVGLAGLRGATHLALLMSLDDKGVDWKSVKAVNVPLDALAEAAKNGTVDAIFPYGLFYPKALADGFTELEPSTIKYLGGFSQVVMIASKDYIAKNADTVKAFNAALGEAIDMANADPEKVCQVDREQTKLDPKFIDTYKIAQFTTSFDRARAQAVVDAELKFGFIDKTVKVEDMYSDLAPMR